VMIQVFWLVTSCSDVV